MRPTVKDNVIKALTPLRCVAYRSVALSPINGAAVIPLDAASIDPLGMLNGGNIIVPQRGVWDVIAATAWNTNATGVRRTWITVNGVQQSPVMQMTPFAGDGTEVIMPCPPMVLNAGDVVALNGYQSSGAVLALLTGLTGGTFMSLSLRQAL